MYEDEPLYENVQKEMEYVKELDERVMKFLHVVQQAPCDIQETTDRFLATIDKLRKNHINKMVISKKFEARYGTAMKYKKLCQREYDFFRRQDDYLSQISADEHYAVDEKLEMATLEVAMCNCQVQLSVRDLELSREQLYRFSKRAEHSFITTLRAHPDKGWAQLYKHDHEKPKSELKRVRSNPVVDPAPMRVKYRHGNPASNSPQTACHSKQGQFNTMRPNTENKSAKSSPPRPAYLTKSKSMDMSGESGSSGSSDEEFPPPPPPLTSDMLNEHERLVTVEINDRRKRYSERSAVDEGIGDIDWNPSSEDINRAVETEITDHVNLIAGLAEKARLENDSAGKARRCDQKQTEASSSTRNINLESSSARNSTRNSKNDECYVNTADMKAAILNDNKTSEVNGLSCPPAESKRDHTTVDSSSVIAASRSDLGESSLELQENKTLQRPPVVPRHGADINADINKITEITDRIKECTLRPAARGVDGQVKLGDDISKVHLQEDNSINEKSQKEKDKKKKSKLKIFTRMFHGPWEGWEES